MTPTQLANDLNLMDQQIKRAKIDGAVKNLLLELTEWSRGHVELSRDVAVVVDQLAARVEDVEDDAGEEGITPETAAALLVQLEQSRNINATFRALLQGDNNPLDEITTKQVLALLKNSDQQISTSQALVQDLVFEEEEDGDDADGDDGDDGDGDDADADDADLLADTAAARANGAVAPVILPPDMIDNPAGGAAPAPEGA